MRNFGVIFLWEFRETVRSRFFKVTSALFGLVALALAVAVIAMGAPGAQETPAVIPDEQVGVMEDESEALREYTIAVADLSGGALLERVAIKLPLVGFVPAEAGAAAAQAAIVSGADACVNIMESGEIMYYAVPQTGGGKLYNQFAAAVIRSAQELCLEGQGLSPAEAAQVLELELVIDYQPVSGSDAAQDGEGEFGAYIRDILGSDIESGSSISVYLLSSVLFMAISFYGQMVSARVTQEKSTRMIEVLSTTASPTELLCGKVLGVGAAGLAQISVFFTLLLALLWRAAQGIAERSDYFGALMTDMAASLAGSAAPMLCYFLLGFMQMAFIYGGLGAMASSSESVSGFASLPLQLPMLGYLMAMVAPMTGPSGLLTAASFVPFLSPFVMLSRMSVEQVPLWQTALSLAILVASVAGTAVLAARLYRRGMLRYGQPPKWRELLAAMKK